MTTLDDVTHADTRRVAEQVLGSTLGGPVRLDVPTMLQERSNVFRFAVLDGPANAPASVVVKRAREPYDPNASAFPAPAWMLFNNWAGLQLLNDNALPRLGPRFLGGNRQAGLVVLEDFGAATGLHDLLLGSDAGAAEQGLMEFATLLGTMHARTIGRQADFDRIRTDLGPSPKTEFHTYAWLEDAFKQAAETLEIAPAPGAIGELRRVIEAMRDPGPFLAYTHGDPCPDNCLYIDRELRLIDFDIGEYRHALRDGVYGRIHFPTCWCVNRTPARIIQRIEATYRAALVQGCPEAADDTLFQRAIVEVCAYWLCEMFQDRPIVDYLDSDAEWGQATLRQRYLTRLDIVARTTAEYGYLEALGSTFQKMAQRLQTLWGTNAEDMLLYPAFR